MLELLGSASEASEQGMVAVKDVFRDWWQLLAINGGAGKVMFGGKEKKPTCEGAS